MNELTTFSESQLPDTLEDLTQFVLVGKAKLNAYMLKLQTVNKLSVAQEIRDQTLKETQEISTALIAAEQRIGELLLAIPTQSGKRTDLQTSSPDGEKVKTKSEITSDMGYSRKNVDEYQQMARNPEVVQRVIENAIANGEVVTKTQVLKEIKAAKAELAGKIADLERESKEREDYITEIESRESEIKEVKVEVVPDDYEELKRKAEMADIHKKDFESMHKAYEEMAEKWKQSESEKQKMIDKAQKPESQNAERLKINAFSFCSGMSNFLETYGGYGYLMSEINVLPDNQKKAVYEGIRSIYRWANEMLNIGIEEVVE